MAHTRRFSRKQNDNSWFGDIRIKYQEVISMVKKQFVSVVLLVFLLASVSLAADTYVSDRAHSHIDFSVKHLMISRVTGSFEDFNVTAQYDENDITKSSVEVVIQAASITTDNNQRDNHLRSDDFFDVEKYPEITFKSKKFVKTDKGYDVIGDFTMHGVTKEITIPFVITGQITDPQGNKRIGIDAHFSIDRTEYGLTWNKMLEGGGVLAGTDVNIDISMELVHSK